MADAILFDMDGVLVHSKEAWFALVRAAAVDLGYPPISRAAFEEGWGQGVQADVAQWYTRHTVDDIERYYTDHFVDHLDRVEVDPDAARVVEALRGEGVRVAVITNTPADLARQILAHAEVEAEVLVGGTDVPEAKPAPDMVRRALEQLGVPADRALVVGDSRFDRQAAGAAGVRFVGLGLDGDVRIERLNEVLTLRA